MSAARPPFNHRLQQALMPPLLAIAQRLPGRVSAGLLAAAGIGEALVNPARLGRAARWAATQRSGLPQRVSCLARLLANRGLYLGESLGIEAGGAARIPRPTRIDGQPLLDRALATGGAIAIRFHVGPGLLADGLLARGYQVLGTTGGLRFRVPAGLRRRRPLPRVQWHDSATAAAGLYALTQALRRGSVVVLTADAADGGRAEFRLSIGGRDVRVQSGWFRLRRLTRSPTFLALLHGEGRLRVTQLQPLPNVIDDMDADRAACQAVLSESLNEYARAYPEQCVSFALWPAPPPGQD